MMIAKAIAHTLRSVDAKTLADHLGISPATLARWQTGHSTPQLAHAGRCYQHDYTALGNAIHRFRLQILFRTPDFAPTTIPPVGAETDTSPDVSRPQRRGALTPPTNSPTYTPVSVPRPATFDDHRPLGMGDALALAADYDLSANELFGIAR